MIERVREIALEASKRILEIYDSHDVSVEIKSDSSPVTEADLCSHEYISQALKDSFSFPVLSEESPVSFDERKDWEAYWLVDPLDGTKNFIARDGQFTVNIALVRNNIPVLGVVHVPVLNETYFGEKGSGAFVCRNEQVAQISNQSSREDLVCAVSCFHDSKASQEFRKEHGITNIRKLGSSLKLCKLAEGEIDVYPRLEGTKEWDTAAAQCIVEEANGKVLDVTTGKPLTYNKPEIRNNHFIASRCDLTFLS